MYRYRLEFWIDDARPFHEVALTSADFTRAVEATFFDGLRRGTFASYDAPTDRARVEPLYLRGDGSPRTKGFRVVLPTATGGECIREYETGFFRPVARSTAGELVAAGRVPEEGMLKYHLAAYPDSDVVERRGIGIELERVEGVIPIRRGSRQALGRAEAWDRPAADVFPVVIPRHVLHEAVDEAKRAPEREVGGVLLGHLRRDDATGELYLEVTCAVPAEETQATETSVTFTADTWARVREVIAWRGEGEIFVGWVHSHPFRFCAECPSPPKPDCVGKVLFYSADDEFLMGLSFARPFMVGLLTAVEPRLEEVLGHPPVRLYGWRDGAIHARGFHVIDA